jgi:hypothetical protein
MYPIHEIDAVILMATTLSSKRRPAQLVEIVAAADMIQGSIPYVEKLGEAMQRLGTAGLISATEDGFTLTPIGLEMMKKAPKKAATEDVIAALKGSLGAYSPKQDHPPIVLSPEQLVTAIQAHKIARKVTGKNLLMPKPKVDRHFKVEGRWRRAAPTRQEKSR